MTVGMKLGQERRSRTLPLGNERPPVGNPSYSAAQHLTTPCVWVMGWMCGSGKKAFLYVVTEVRADY